MSACGEPTNDRLRKMWRDAGGEFYGPRVETGSMPEALLLPFLRALYHHQSPETLEEITDARVHALALRAVLQRWSDMADAWLDGERATGDGTIQVAVTREYLQEVRDALTLWAPR